MTLLYTPSYPQGAGYNAERQYIKWLALDWLPGCLVSAGNPFVVRENVFGGFEVHLRFEPRYYEWDSGGWPQDSILIDYYATAPGNPTPIAAGGVICGVGWAGNVEGIVANFIQAGSTGRIWVFRLPPPPNTHWFQLSPDTLPDMFCIQTPNLTTILPMPVC